MYVCKISGNHFHPKVNHVIEIPMTPCEELVSLGEREFAAFIRTVTELFGADQARGAAEDWLEAVTVFDCSSSRPRHSWRLVTVAATTRFFDRVIATQHLLRRALGPIVDPSHQPGETDTAPIASPSCEPELWHDPIIVAKHYDA